MTFLIWVEQTALSVWVRESPTLWAFPFILFLHTLGLALVAGIGVALNAWILTLAPRYPIAPLRPLFPVMWAGFTINLVSGLLLLAAYPAKALTNPVFYVKLVLVALAVAELEWVRKVAFEEAEPRAAFRPSAAITALAAASFLLWGGAVVTGRLLAYTHSILMASEGF